MILELLGIGFVGFLIDQHNKEKKRRQTEYERNPYRGLSAKEIMERNYEWDDDKGEWV